MSNFDLGTCCIYVNIICKVDRKLCVKLASSPRDYVMYSHAAYRNTLVKHNLKAERNRCFKCNHKLC